jgi:hypothetical protein
MGGLLTRAQAVTVTKSLKWMFDDDLQNTFAKVEQLRKVYPNFLDPTVAVGDAKAARKRTLRFAALLLTDGIPFDGSYPARKFKQWLKWLTWLDVKGGGTVKLDGATYNGSASELIIETLYKALPPGGNPTKVFFKWDEDANVGFTVLVKSSPATIEVISVKANHPSINEGSDDQDDV